MVGAKLNPLEKAWSHTLYVDTSWADRAELTLCERRALSRRIWHVKWSYEDIGQFYGWGKTKTRKLVWTAIAKLERVKAALLAEHIDILKLTPRTRNYLIRNDLKTVGHVMERTPLELEAIVGFGGPAVVEVITRLNLYGLGLRHDPTDQRPR